MTKKQQFDPARLDVRRFAQEAETIEGSRPLGAFTRLAAETQGRGHDEPVTWSARGELRNPGHVQPQVWLHLMAGARLSLICQRCLAPVDVEVTVQRPFRFVADESVAAAEDDASEEDVLAESRAFDLPGLVEDELLMAMPVVPRHDVCPQAIRLSAGDEEFEAAQEQRENPFAVLDKLRKH